MKAVKSGTLAALALLSTAGVAAADFSVSADVAERLESVLTRSGGELTYFQGPSEMIGIGITMRNGQQMVVYATPDGTTIFSGVAVDTDTGQNLTRADIDSMPAPDFSPIFRQISEALARNPEAGERRGMYAASEGPPDAQDVFYVFIDPKCPFCHSIKNAFDSVKAQGHELVVHYIPIGILGPESRNLASAMAGSRDDTAIKIFMAASDRSFRITNADVISQGSKGAEENLAMFRDLAFDAVPVVISRTAGEYSARQGGMSVEMIVGQLAGGERQLKSQESR